MIRRPLSVLLLAGALGACGGDPEPRERAPAPASSSTSTQEARTTTVAPEPTQTVEPTTSTNAQPNTDTDTDTTTVPDDGGAAAPEELTREREEEPGGAGDEQAIRTDVRLTGSGGRIRPARVSVPGFIRVRLELRSADGAPYRLAVDGRRVRAGGSLTLPGLPSGERYVARGTPGGRVVIDFSAEPGG